jgi:predicted RNase H-like HicB family nuclease
VKFILSNYIEKALAKAQYDKLDDNSYAGRIPVCLGVVAFAKTLKECEDELRSALEDWIYLGLRQGHRLPVLQGINLNRKIRRESMESLRN